MMLCLHLFNTSDYENLFTPIIFIGNTPIIYYISLFSDACVPIFAFVSGFGLYYKYQSDKQNYHLQANLKKIYSLYKNYWVILFIFVLGVGSVLQPQEYPGSFLKFFMAFTGLTASDYNGAAWFFTIYVLFFLLSKPIFQILDRFPKLFFISVLVLYFIGFYFRIYNVPEYSNPIFNWLHVNLALFSMTVFQFLLGAYPLKYKWKSYVSHAFERIRFSNLFALIGIVLLIVAHAYVPNFIVAPLTGLGFILLFAQIDLSKPSERALDFLTPHATNIWLTHMFFYLVFFRDFIYSPKYILPIFLLLLACCIATSYIINLILNFKVGYRYNKKVFR